MRLIAITNGVLAVLVTLSSAASAEEQNSKEAIQKKLEGEYQLTKTTDDKSDIVTAGSAIVLHKDKVLMVAATSTANPCMNTYKDGKISPAKACGVGEKLRRLPVFGHVPGGSSAPASRNFVSGEKFWVTKIDVKDNGIVLDFFSDAINDVRYKAALTIPFGALTPSPDEALKAVAEVITEPRRMTRTPRTQTRTQRGRRGTSNKAHRRVVSNKRQRPANPRLLRPRRRRSAAGSDRAPPTTARGGLAGTNTGAGRGDAGRTC